MLVRGRKRWKRGRWKRGKRGRKKLKIVGSKDRRQDVVIEIGPVLIMGLGGYGAIKVRCYGTLQDGLRSGNCPVISGLDQMWAGCVTDPGPVTSDAGLLSGNVLDLVLGSFHHGSGWDLDLGLDLMVTQIISCSELL